MFEITEIIDKYVAKRFSDINDAAKHKNASLVSRRFHEYLLLLEMRFRDLDIADYKLTNDEHVGETQSLKTIQFSFLENTEAFHEQVYATLSSFAAFLSLFLKHEDKRNIHLGSSLRKFIHDIDSLVSEPNLQEALKILDASRYFRDKLVIHPQIHAQHDWMTQGGESTSTLIYYTVDYTIADPTKDGLPIYANFADEDGSYIDFLRGMCPWMKDIYLPPDYRSVYKALQAVVKDILINK